MSAKRSNLWKTLARMSELDTEDLVEDRWRTLLSEIIKKQLLEMFDNVYKKTFVTWDFRNKQNTNDAEKTVDNEVIKEQMVHRIESSKVSNIDVKRIPYDID